MPSPTKRPGSSNWQFKRRLPKDIQAILAKMPREQWPKNWYASQIVVPLGTSDNAQAKAKFAEAAADVEKRFAALRAGPRPLTHKQVVALSGTLYKAFTENLEDDPGTAERWLGVVQANKAAQTGQFGLGAKLGIYSDDDDRREASMEARFGGLADALLENERLVTDADSRWLLIEQIAKDMTQAARRLSDNADGDYSADAYASRFPTLPDPQTASRPKRTLSALADAWSAGAEAREVNARTRARWHSVILRFGEWLGHDDLSQVTAAKVQEWGDVRNSEGIKPKTINDTDFAALRAIFRWGMRRGWLTANPADDARIEGRGKKTTRDKFFSDAEITAILNASSSVQGTKKEHSKTTAAKRWVPWLCAYSGARVMEMIQLRKQDLRRDGQTWVMRITPDAGSVKTNQFRDVPVHEHLVAMGFIDFVGGSDGGSLFCQSNSDGSIDGSAAGVYKRVYDLIREVVTDPDVQPNHAWRYTFKTKGFEQGIDRHALDALCGHGSKSQGEEYTKVTLKKRMEAMTSFSRYMLAELPKLSG